MSKEKTIKGKKVEAYYLPVRSQLKLLTFLGVNIGGSITGLKNVTDKDLDDDNMIKMGANIVESFVENLKNLDNDVAIYWMDEILKQVRINGAHVTMEADFSNGQLSFLFDVIQFGLEVNYKDFLQEKFGTIKDLLLELMNKKSKELPNPIT